MAGERRGRQEAVGALLPYVVNPARLRAANRSARHEPLVARREVRRRRVDAAKYGVDGSVKWAMAGRSAAKLAEVRDEIGAPKDTPLIVADANDAASRKAMVGRAKAILTTVGPYQLYGSDLVADCATPPMPDSSMFKAKT
eukprot:gene698-960_t